MPKFIDFTGHKIGRVLILQNVQKGKASRWKCKCDCGIEFICLHRSFIRGDTFECNECRFERRRGIDLTGRKYGRWTVLRRTIDKYRRTKWEVRCDCGKLGLVAGNVLGKKGRSMSCGCLGRKEKSIYANETLYPPIHLTSKMRIYHIRTRIIHSCYKEKHPTYKYFGAKGFTVCDLWRNGAESFFYWCMENGWKPNHVVGIKDGEKVFSPENCYVIEEGEHIRQRLIKKITYNGITKTSREWANEVGLDYHTLHYRLRKGYSIEDAIFAKSHQFSGTKKYPDEKIKELYQSGLSLADIGRQLGYPYVSIGKRLKVMGIEYSWKGRRKYKEKLCQICNKTFRPVSSRHYKCNECKNAKDPSNP